MTRPGRRALRLPDAPISLQILALLFGGLIVAQFVTLALTLLIPPEPPQRHSLAEIAQVLRSDAAKPAPGPDLLRSVEAAPPALNSPGWVVSTRASADLARLVDAPQADVRILFYAPPPLAGAVGPPPHGLPPPRDSAANERPRIAFAGFVLAQADPPPAMGGGMGPGGPGGMGSMGPGGMGPGGMGAGEVRSGEIGPWRSGSGGMIQRAWPDPAMRSGESAPREIRRTIDRDGGWRQPGRGAGDRPASAPRGPESQGAWGAGPRANRGGAVNAGGPEGPRGFDSRPRVRAPLDAAVFAPRQLDIPRVTIQADLPAMRPAPAPEPVRITPAPAPVTATPPVAAQVPTAKVELDGPKLPAAPDRAAAAPIPQPVADRVLAAPSAPSVFGLGRAPWFEGEFVAALRTPAGWVTVRPKPEGFPNSWQRRVLLWFGLSFALVAPLGYLFTRRLTAPLRSFAEAAERLGREPSADLAPLDGPAEVGRAARAFNRMQQRLKRYVDDRTGMVGAISHDLRTPLARMRFKLERAPPALRAALARDILQMEEMITSVLSFMRDAAEGAQRDRVDLRSILECVVDDAGAGAELAPGASLAVEVDVLALQRVFENLVDNALKYGAAARVSLRQDGHEAVVEVADDGPGLPPEELEQVFKPFYRSAQAKASGQAGIGLGLSVSRAAVRAHGGDLVLRSSGAGLVAEVRLPAGAALSIAA